MDFFHDIFHYRFLMQALLAAVLSGITCGVMGTYIVCRRMVFLSGGITHASFGGIGIAYWLGRDPILGAMLFAVLSALGIEWANDRGRIRQDSAIGIAWSAGMAAGIIFIYLTPGYAPNLMSYLFGSILTVTHTDTVRLGILTVAVLGLWALCSRAAVFAAFDREFARSQGIPVKAVSRTAAVLAALTIVLSIRVVGIVLLISLLTMPAVIANSLSNSYGRITLLAVVVAVAGNVAGLAASYGMNIPAGAATIFLLTLTLIVVKLLPLCRKSPRSSAR